MVLHKNLTDVDLNLHIPKVHTHVEADILDLDKYTKAEVDALLSGTTFLDLDDTPSSYVGEALSFLYVNAGETGIDFLSGYFIVSEVVSSNGTLSATSSVVGGLRKYDLAINPNYKTQAQLDLIYVPKVGGFTGRMTGPLYIDPGIGKGIRVTLNPGGSYGNLIHYNNDYVGYAGYRTMIGSGGIPCVLQGSETRPRYGTTPAAQGVEVALLSDVVGGGVSSFLDLSDTPAIYPPITPGDPVGLKVTETGDGLEFVDGWEIVFPLANEAAVSAKDTGGTPRVLIYITNSDQIYLGDIVLPLRIFGFNTRPTYTDGFYTETQIALLSDIGSTPPAAHTHNYTDRALEVVTNGDPVNPEVLFDIDGDVVTIETTEVKVTYG